MNAQRLRNLTTGRLHTEIGHIYEDLEKITGKTGLMTHMLPRAARAVEPWLREHVTDPRFWDGEYDKTHTGEIELPEPTEQDRAEMFDRYIEMPNPLAGKDVVIIQANTAMSQLNYLVGKTIAEITRLQAREHDDQGFLRILFTDDTEVVITAGYGGFSGKSLDEYPTTINVREKSEALIKSENQNFIQPIPK